MPTPQPKCGNGCIRGVARCIARDLHPVVAGTNDEPFFAPVELKGFAMHKRKRRVGLFAPVLTACRRRHRPMVSVSRELPPA